MNVEEVLAKYSSPTTYEKEHGLEPKSAWQLVLDAGDVKFFSRDAYDWTKTLLIVFRAGTTDNQCGWMINEQQAAVMIRDFPELYTNLNTRNSLTRQTRTQVELAADSPDDVWSEGEGGIEI